ncbi:NDP-hexose 2,3-dehydratase family protein [Streptomyces sp. NPDC050636]|uniref:NDP-hexose 2,3-dehydratase family protein n=1 Tax=Streptomyces sp. NPDC050636 TaxID=3154510 RepID=UPI003424A005
MPPYTAPRSLSLRPHEDDTVADRLTRSARQTTQGVALHTNDILGWLADRGRAHRFTVDRIGFDELKDWSFDERTGNLGHRSGRFFTVEGLDVTTSEGSVRSWQQPIIKQPEIGILGLLAKEFDGVLHFLMQAKMEPGNPNLLQLSPTVQATRSNYTKVHQGADVKYIEYFTAAGRGRVLADVLQSEHGSWFHHKSNRNMIVETSQEVRLDDDFCWLTLGQLSELLRHDNLVNMDSRTVLACLPTDRDEPGVLHPTTELLSWFTGERSRQDLHSRRIPLADVAGWTRGEDAIEHVQGRFFRVVAVRAQAGNREVSGWTQPLFEPVGTGIAAFLARRIGGVVHVLAQARAEAGFLDTVELGPTVQYTPANYGAATGPDHPPFHDLVLNVDPAAIRYQAVHSEEGGRFLNAESRYLIIDAEAAGLPFETPPGYCWITPGQLSSLARHGHYVNVQARTLLACFITGAVRW